MKQPTSPSERSPEDVAAEWLARREGGWTPAEAAAYAQWREADPRHEAAAVRLEATHRRLESLSRTLPDDLAAELEQLDGLNSRTGRKWWNPLLAAAAALMLLATVSLVVRSKVAPYETHHVTGPADARTLELPDGSQVRLAEASELDVQLTRSERRIRLTGGSAVFAVAKDSDRPFIVDAGTVAIQALGTVFEVSRPTDGKVTVRVTEGRVRVDPLSPGRSRTEIVTLAAGQSWHSPDETMPGVLTARAGPAAVPRLTFADTPLAEAIVAFNLHSPVKLELGDADLATRTVGGQFSADAAESFAQLLAANGDIRLERPASDRIVLRRSH